MALSARDNLTIAYVSGKMNRGDRGNMSFDKWQDSVSNDYELGFALGRRLDWLSSLDDSLVRIFSISGRDFWTVTINRETGKIERFFKAGEIIYICVKPDPYLDAARMTIDRIKRGEVKLEDAYFHPEPLDE